MEVNWKNNGSTFINTWFSDSSAKKVIYETELFSCNLMVPFTLSLHREVFQEVKEPRICDTRRVIYKTHLKF